LGKPRLQAGKAGAFALVAGVSQYEFLKGQSTYDLRPLFVTPSVSRKQRKIFF
jgi:hypothetical protein